MKGLYCTIKAGEVPPIPENRFLSRNYEPKKTNEDVKKEKDKKSITSEDERDERHRRRESSREERKRWSYDAAGRKVKGRGNLVSGLNNFVKLIQLTENLNIFF